MRRLRLALVLGRSRSIRSSSESWASSCSSSRRSVSVSALAIVSFASASFSSAFWPRSIASCLGLDLDLLQAPLAVELVVAQRRADELLGPAGGLAQQPAGGSLLRLLVFGHRLRLSWKRGIAKRCGDSASDRRSVGSSTRSARAVKPGSRPRALASGGRSSQRSRHFSAAPSAAGTGPEAGRVRSRPRRRCGARRRPSLPTAIALSARSDWCRFWRVPRSTWASASRPARRRQSISIAISTP